MKFYEMEHGQIVWCSQPKNDYGRETPRAQSGWVKVIQDIETEQGVRTRCIPYMQPLGQTEMFYPGTLRRVSLTDPNGLKYEEYEGQLSLDM